MAMTKHAVEQRDDIQGLRAVAVIAVVLYHANRGWLPGGFVGVDVFLVISGYLITGIILHGRATATFRFATFYAARIRRIVPAYLAMLAVVTLACAVLLTPEDFERHMRSLRSAVVAASNQHFARRYDYFAPAAHELPLLHTWSLAVEIQFYLLLPALLVWVPQRALGRVVLAGAGLIVAYSSVRLHLGHRQAEYFSLVARIPEFLVGSLVAVYAVGRDWSERTCAVASIAGLALVLGSFMLIDENMAFPGWLAMIPCVGAALVIAARRGKVNVWLSTPSLVWVGALSYSLYLWHWPLLAGMRYFLGTYALPAMALLAFAGATLAFSYLSYRCLEVPLRRSGGASIRRRYAVLVVTCGAIVAAAHVINARLVDPLPDSMTDYARADEICHGRILGDCLRGDRSSQDEVLLLGDSHGAQLNAFADIVGRAMRARVRVITASNCIPFEGFDVGRLEEWARAPCRDQIDAARRHLPTARAVVVAGKWVFQSDSDAFMKALDAFLRQTAAPQRPVLVLAQVPMLVANAQRVHRFEHLWLGRTTIEIDARWGAANARLRRLVESHPDVTYLDLTKSDVFADAPFDDGVLIYMDQHHLNEEGSRRYGALAAPHFERWAGRFVRDGR